MHADRGRAGPLWIAAGVLLASAIGYSQTLAFAWDEGFHLLAAQIILRGKRPYLDFLFPQTPLYTYFNALAMKLFGESWRVVHAISAVALIGAAMLTADFVWKRLEDDSWKLAAALCALALVALNSTELWYCTIGQPYAFSLLLVVAAFRLAVHTVEERAASPLLISAAAGLCAGAAADGTLLTAPFAPVLLIWIWIESGADRWKRSAAFLAGIAPPFLPLAWLFAHGPRQAIFAVIQYHALFRQADWPNAGKQNLDVATSWMNNYEAVVLIGLACLGLTYIVKRSNWAGGKKREFHLCVWMIVAESAYLCIPRPTFGRYYLFVIPFLAIFASVGLYAIASLIGSLRMPWRYPAILAMVATVAFVKYSVDDANDYSWRDLEKVARKVDAVTPAQAPLLADEQVYFLTRRMPPPGNEYMDSHKLDLPDAKAAAMHVISMPKLKQEVTEGRFATVAICNDKDKVDGLGLPGRYRQQAEESDCSIFWDWK